MEILKPLLSPLSERAKSPFFSSFLISWSIINWKIIYITLFISNEILAPHNKFEYVRCFLDYCHTLIFPLITSFIYIFLYPYLDKVIFRYTETKKREKIDEKIKIGRLHSVQGNLYYDLKLDFQNETKKVLEFETLISEEKTKVNEITIEKEKLLMKFSATEERLKILQERELLLNKRHDLNNLISGRWRSYQNGEEVDRINFAGNEYYTANKNNQFEKTYNLRAIDIDFEREQVVFVKAHAQKIEIVLLNELKMISNDLLEGTENGKSIIYKKDVIEKNLDGN